MTEEDMKKTWAESFGLDLRNTDRFYAFEASILEMRNIQKQVVQVEFNDPMENDTTTFEDIDIGREYRVDREERMKAMFQEVVRTHMILAKSFYKDHLAKTTKVTFLLDSSFDSEES